LKSRHILLDDSVYNANQCVMTGMGRGEQWAVETKQECLKECDISNKFVLTLLESLIHKEGQVALDPRARLIDTLPEKH
jgi:hypothetical protein